MEAAGGGAIEEGQPPEPASDGGSAPEPEHGGEENPLVADDAPIADRSCSVDRSSADERSSSPIRQFSSDSSDDDGEDLATVDASKQLYCCHSASSPASSQAKHIVQILVTERGWKEWPVEEHTYPGASSVTLRPKDCQKVAFCNSGFWSLSFEISIDQTELMYDRIELAKLTESRDGTRSQICPPTYVLKSGGELPEIQPTPGPQVWFLKQNLTNFGLGVVPVCSPAEALPLLAAGAAYVLQPHIPSPLLFDGRKFHVRLYLMVAQKCAW